MSSNPIRRIAALVVAIIIPFGAAAPSAHASTWWHAPHANVVTSDDHTGPGFTHYAPARSSWS